MITRALLQANLDRMLMEMVHIQCSCFPVRVAPSAFLLGSGVAATAVPFCAILSSLFYLVALILHGQSPGRSGNARFFISKGAVPV